MDDEIYVDYGASIDSLIDQYGVGVLAMAAVFECECKCGEVYRLEPDGYHICEECGTKVQSPLIVAGLI